MPLIPADSLPHFEKVIYLPMVLTVLEQDRNIFEKSNFKLNRPYITLIEKAIKAIQNDSKDAKLYMRKHNMKVIRGKHDDMATEYVFFHGGYEEHRRYLNVRLRNRTEELLEFYLAKG